MTLYSTQAGYRCLRIDLSLELGAKLMFVKARDVSEIAKALGSLGGKRRAKVLTPEQRREIARKAAAASATVRSKKAAAKRKGKGR